MGQSELSRKKNRVRRAAAPLVLCAIGLAASGTAGAACASFKTAFFADDAAGQFLPADGEATFGAPIVGLWTVEFIARGNTNGIPDGALIDFGTATWHGDGTEAMVSGGRAPATGDVCMGVWHQIGRSTYKLTHIAMAWGSVYLGPTKIDEVVTLDATGNNFHGHFTITAYEGSAVPGGEFTESVVVPPTPIVGDITGKRVVVD